MDSHKHPCALLSSIEIHLLPPHDSPSPMLLRLSLLLLPLPLFLLQPLQPLQPPSPLPSFLPLPQLLILPLPLSSFSLHLLQILQVFGQRVLAAFSLHSSPC